MIAQSATWNHSCSSCKGSIKEAEEQEEVAAFERSHHYGSMPTAPYTVPFFNVTEAKAPRPVLGQSVIPFVLQHCQGAACIAV